MRRPLMGFTITCSRFQIPKERLIPQFPGTLKPRDVRSEEERETISPSPPPFAEASGGKLSSPARGEEE